VPLLAERPGWSIEVSAGHVGIYRARDTRKPGQLMTFAQEAREILAALR
jgi:hypothetical protein